MVYAESRLKVGNPPVQPEHHDKSAENPRSFSFVPDVFKKSTGRLSFLTLRGKEIALTDTPADEANNMALSPHESKVAYAVRGSIYLVAPGGVREKLCDDCVGGYHGIYHWSSDGENILCDAFQSGGTRMHLLSLSTGEQIELLRHPKYRVFDARFSPDDRWIAFHALVGPARRQLFIAPFQGRKAIPESEWVAVTDGSKSDAWSWWSPDGNLLYFISDRDGFRCIWAQPLAPSKRPVKSAFPVRHLHRSGRSMSTLSPVELKLSVARHKIVFTLEELTGNIWMMQPQAQE
ncbi:hypothetical protein MYX78_10055 [Acidobacteria bacterium AH-259-G07]|nr:hypothetical protein [Acidobacteria bacterium AH-259-G07]